VIVHIKPLLARPQALAHETKVEPFVIHQHIFASPKPGMTETEFQDYWLNHHAVEFASKITQIKKYKIDLRIPFEPEGRPIWNAVAEIWLQNDEEQLDSMQSPEFILGARRDEPNWAAFWNTVGLDCDTRTVGQRELPAGAVKLLVLYGRAEGLDRDQYRSRHLEVLSSRVSEIPDILRHDISFARDGLYAVGEPRFDAIGHFWFAFAAAAEAMTAGPDRALVLPGAGNGIVNPAQVFPMLTTEHWVIGPQARE
jgi:hypothetical protein